MARYHPILVVLHWLMALMILLALFFGKTVLERMPNTSPEKAELLAGHMSLGLMVGGLLVLRLLVRLLSTKPPHASTGNPILDTIGGATHWAFYALIAGMVLSGLGMAASNGLFPIVFGGSGDPLPESLSSGGPRVAHGLISTLLILLIVLHFAAALYHQIVLKDGLLRRMWFGRRST